MSYTEQELREHGHHYQPYTTCPICFPVDPDETIRRLRSEVERVANLLESAGDRLGVPEYGQYQGEWMHAAAARRLLARLEGRK